LSRRGDGSRADGGVADSGVDEQQLCGQMRQATAAFISRARPLNRSVEVFNDRLERWEPGRLASLVATGPQGFRVHVAVPHARRERTVTIEIGGLQRRLPRQTWPLWGPPRPRPRPGSRPRVAHHGPPPFRC